MTHDEYLAGLERFGDGPEETQLVLDHVASCATCAREQREIGRRLARDDRGRRSTSEEILRWAAAAVTVAILAIGMRGAPARRAEPTASYRIVGDGSGVVAYTPDGVLTGTASTLPKEAMR